MVKTLKTLEQIKSEAYKVVKEWEGITIFYGSNVPYFINQHMYSLFGNKINVSLNNGTYWDYKDTGGWVYIKKWFELYPSISVLLDDDFVI